MATTGGNKSAQDLIEQMILEQREANRRLGEVARWTRSTYLCLIFSILVTLAGVLATVGRALGWF